MSTEHGRPSSVVPSSVAAWVFLALVNAVIVFASLFYKRIVFSYYLSLQEISSLDKTSSHFLVWHTVEDILISLGLTAASPVSLSPHAASMKEEKSSSPESPPRLQDCVHRFSLLNSHLKRVALSMTAVMIAPHLPEALRRMYQHWWKCHC